PAAGSSFRGVDAEDARRTPAKLEDRGGAPVALVGVFALNLFGARPAFRSASLRWTILAGIDAPRSGCGIERLCSISIPRDADRGEPTLRPGLPAGHSSSSERPRERATLPGAAALSGAHSLRASRPMPSRPRRPALFAVLATLVCVAA